MKIEKAGQQKEGVMVTEPLGRIIARKLASTFLAAFIISMGWSSWEIATAEEIVPYQGTEFYGMTLVFFFYIGFFVLVYGNLVSFFIELFQRKWFERADWLYVVLLGGFGSAIGLLFPLKNFIFIGILVGILYSLIDKRLLKSWQREKGNKALFIAPFFAFLMLWIYFQVASASLPPYTAEEAVEFATSGEGTAIDRFPNEAGTWEGEIEGYRVERTTAVEQIDEGLYNVTFTEKWQNEHVTDSWMMSYHVDRESTMLHDEEGNMPPYDR